MAKLVRLQIIGVRSFGPEDPQHIKFATPLTLILGQNGCGKTTIIEAIRYACTGSTPAGTAEGFWLNDPKISGKSLTQGQVKLRILDSRGNEITICRIAEVSLKSNTSKPKFQTKSVTVNKLRPDGVEESFPGRCIDMTNYFCQSMNVSPSILNNVIFCHQENSTWPLEEGQKLKEKFDEIFDAQKYNKCTDHLRKLLKIKEGSIKLLKLELQYAKEKKEVVENDRRRLQDKQEKLQSLEDEVAAKIKEKEPIDARMAEIRELQTSLLEVQSLLSAKEQKKQSEVEEQANLRRKITSEFVGTDEELREKIATFQSDRLKDEDKVRQLEERKVGLESKCRQIAGEIQNIQNLMGKLNQEKDQHEAKCNEKKLLVDRACAALKVNQSKGSGDSSDLFDTSQNVITDLTEALNRAQIELNELDRRRDSEEATLQSAIDLKREKLATLRQTVGLNDKECLEWEAKVSEVKSKLKAVEVHIILIKDKSNKLKALDKNIYNLQKSFSEEDEKNKVEEYKREVRAKEVQLETLETDSRILQSNDVTEGKLETEKHSIADKKTQIHRTLNKHSEKLRQLFGDSCPEKDLKKAVEDIQTQQDSEVRRLTSAINAKEREVTKLEAECQNQKRTVETYEGELRTKKEKISEVCRGQDYDAVMEATNKKRENLQRDKGHYSSAKIMYEAFVKEFEKESPCCPVCSTEFLENRGRVRTIIDTMRKKIAKIPEKLRQVEEDLRKEEELYGQLQQLKATNEDVARMESAQLPWMQEELADSQASLASTAAELETLKEDLAAPQRKVEICRSMTSDLAALEQNQQDLERSQKTVEYLSQQLVQVASNKSKQEIESEIDVLKADVSGLRGKIESQQTVITKWKDRMQKTLQERNELATGVATLEASISDGPKLSTNLEEANAKVTELKNRIAEDKAAVEAREAELKAAQLGKQKRANANKEKISEARNTFNNNKKLIEDIEKMQREIVLYQQKGNEAKLESTKKNLDELKTDSEMAEKTKGVVIEKITKQKEDNAKQEVNFRNLNDNLELRNRKTVERELNVEIDELKRKIRGDDFRRLAQEMSVLKGNGETLDKAISSINGQKTEIDSSITELERELNKVENREASKQYMSKYYQRGINQHVIEDMKKYVMALEKAILEFHKSRMVEINRTIREYWRDIYRGNDIDYIEIRTEHASQGAAKRRTYDYKVMQIKRGVALEMRGRCSAGQKVLACLIIRMAIAEVLSLNCGILALDEPTTNLDRENIISLSEALYRIVNTRQSERNFQLIVITHDEDFVTTLTRAQGVNHYFRVSRDRDGFSVISQETP